MSGPQYRGDETSLSRSGAVPMHLNRLSTAALMRLTILASLNLLMGRMSIAG